MTFSLAGRCARTGSFGVAAATCDLAVGSRVAHAEAGVGAVITQHRTDPRLGPQGLSLLRAGTAAGAVVEQLVASTPHADWRQLAVIDSAGRTAACSGAKVVTTACEVHGLGCIAVGNCLADAAVGSAMVAAFLAAPSEPLAERILRALEAGRDAGGQAGGTGAALTERSASIKITKTGDSPGFAVLDLRVDIHHSAVHEMRRLYEFHNIYGEYSKLRDKSPKDSPSMVDYEAEYLRKSKTVIERPSVYR